MPRFQATMRMQRRTPARHYLFHMCVLSSLLLCSQLHSSAVYCRSLLAVSAETKPRNYWIDRNGICKVVNSDPSSRINRLVEGIRRGRRKNYRASGCKRASDRLTYPCQSTNLIYTVAPSVNLCCIKNWWVIPPDLPGTCIIWYRPWALDRREDESRLLSMKRR